MKPLTAGEIRASIVNAPADEIERMPLPGLHETMWESREYLGWRDANSPQRGYLVYWRSDEPFGIVLRASGASMSRTISAMCSLCRTQQPATQVSLFSVPKAGAEGLNGNTVGTYICSDLGCSNILRILPPHLDMQVDPTDVVAHRASGLLKRLDSFTGEVLKSAV